MIQSIKDLTVYNRSYKLAMDIFHVVQTFPIDEKYSLTSQIVRSSRSISGNISEGWAKREYESVFRQHFIHALGSASETQTWLDFSKDCGYSPDHDHQRISKEAIEVSKMLSKLHSNWKSFKK